MASKTATLDKVLVPTKTPTSASRSTPIDIRTSSEEYDPATTESFKPRLDIQDPITSLLAIAFVYFHYYICLWVTCIIRIHDRVSPMRLAYLELRITGHGLLFIRHCLPSDRTGWRWERTRDSFLFLFLFL